MEKKYTVTISDRRKIPHIGFGPIHNPIKIDEHQFNLLKVLGFNVKVIDEPKKKEIESFEVKKKEIINKVTNEEKTIDTNDEILDNEDEQLKSNEEILEDSEDEEILDTNEEEIINTNDEILDDEEVESDEEILEDSEEDIITDDINKLTKAELKEKLKELNISYSKKANLKELRSLLREEIK